MNLIVIFYKKSGRFLRRLSYYTKYPTNMKYNQGK